MLCGNIRLMGPEIINYVILDGKTQSEQHGIGFKRKIQNLEMLMLIKETL